MLALLFGNASVLHLASCCDHEREPSSGKEGEKNFSERRTMMIMYHTHHPPPHR